MSRVRHDAGYIVINDPGSDIPILEVDTLQCVHCGGQWFPRPGSGTIRGYCQNCAGPVCGPGCAECVPTDLYLENMEKGRLVTFKPVCVPVSFAGEV